MSTDKLSRLNLWFTKMKRTAPRMASRPFRFQFSAFSFSAFFCRGLGLQRILGLLDQGVKRDFIANGNVGQDLAVERDVSGAQTFNEAVVAEAGGAAGGVEAHDPEGAPFAFFLPAVAIGVLPG